MQAIYYERTGPADEVLTLGDVPEPALSPGDVLVRVKASGINPSDTKRRAGWRGAAMEFPRVVPHSDGAGVIEAVGPGVYPTRIGERVWLYNAQRGRALGTCAEFCALPAAQAITMPAHVGFDEGACFGVPAQTAHFAVLSDGPVQGQTILIQGAGGAVGHYAVQWAKLSGATVIATASHPERAAHAKSAGADHLINYRHDDVLASVRSIAPNGVDRIVEVDFGANVDVDKELIKPGGTIAAYSSTAVPEPLFPYYPLAYKGVTLRLVQAYILPERARQAAINNITQTLRSGTLTNAVAQVFDLQAAPAAHNAVENGGTVGNVVVRVAPD